MQLTRALGNSWFISFPPVPFQLLSATSPVDRVTVEGTQEGLS